MLKRNRNEYKNLKVSRKQWYQQKLSTYLKRRDALRSRYKKISDSEEATAQLKKEIQELRTRHGKWSKSPTYKQEESAIKARIKSNYTHWRASPEYAKKVKKIAHRIRMYNKAIKRIEVWERKIRQIDEVVCDFMALETLQNSIPKLGHFPEPKIRLARHIFYKYGMEQRIHGSYLSEFVGAKFRETPCSGRLKFTRSFKKNKANYDAWKSFRQYLLHRD